MKEIILSIVFFLLCTFLTLEEVQGGIGDDTMIKKAEDIKASVDIAHDMFVYGVRGKYENTLRLWSLLYLAGYKDFAEEVIRDVNPNGILELDLFYKHNEKYKYNASDYDMSILSCTILNGMIRGYKAGMIESLNAVLKTHKDVADSYKDTTPKMYTEYLEKKRKFWIYNEN